MRIVWNTKGFYQLRSHPAIVRNLESRARAIADAAGEGYDISSYQGKTVKQGRWQVPVIATTAKAWADNKKNDTLIKALYAGRG